MQRIFADFYRLTDHAEFLSVMSHVTSQDQSKLIYIYTSGDWLNKIMTTTMLLLMMSLNNGSYAWLAVVNVHCDLLI